MSEIDWSKAPEGATHYCAAQEFEGVKYGEHWLKPGFYFSSYHGEWRADLDRVPEQMLIPRPSSTAWNGEGLPPVGTVCEALDSNKEWQTVRITAIAEKGHCFIDEEGYEIYRNHTEFRPIRTPEQIAAEERDKAVCELKSVAFERFRGVRAGCDAIDAICEALYDAGYRKTEG